MALGKGGMVLPSSLSGRESGLSFWVLLTQFMMVCQEGVLDVSVRTNTGKPAAGQPLYVQPGEAIVCS